MNAYHRKISLMLIEKVERELGRIADALECIAEVGEAMIVKAGGWPPKPEGCEEKRCNLERGHVGRHRF